ncbi:hypothetical protein GOP47_0007368 [Adiantum capillus-veneris]|uniref:DUF4200 domain-containing protein n=1 Tax=Adiantum capillus-veneris TaxID=13818 RepID=A0A9D4ZJ85_ADICA|nr:hypothetical protein GOP47_0007368 [Adiantum capillus-veneris]
MTSRREIFDAFSSHVSSTVASHRSFASQVPSSARTSGHGAECGATGPHTSDSIIPPHVHKPAETIDEEWAKMPFVMPDDEELFRIRGLEKRRKEQKKLDNMLPVAEKTTFASRMAATVASDSLKEELLAINEHIAKEMESIKAATVLPTEHYHKEKENMAEFIAKKREIFLVQMSLDNKRAEIRKLEERSFQREEALRKSEEMLVEDTAQFEAFLKQNDEKVQEALKKAEQQTKMKQDKLADIKRLNASMATIKKDLNKFQEQLDECKKYKDFILSLTPKDWLDANSNTALESTRKKSGDVGFGGEIAVNDGSGEEVDSNTLEKMYFQSPNQAKLEESISALAGVPPEFIEQTEKSQEKQRRLALREEKMEKQRMEQEKRAERSLERAHAPIPRKTGKPVMFRSRLFKKKKMQVTEVKTDDDKELTEFLERDY